MKAIFEVCDGRHLQGFDPADRLAPCGRRRVGHISLSDRPRPTVLIYRPEPPSQKFGLMAVESMNKRLISRLMHERMSGLRSSGVYFFRGDFEYVLRGVVLEYVPRGIHLWDFWFPLFDFFGPNLNYSDRLTVGAFIGKGEKSETEFVDHVLASPEAQVAFWKEPPPSLSDFVRYLLSSDALLNPHARLIQAASLFLMDQASQAVTLLDEIRTTLHPSDVPHWERLRDCLRLGPEAALELLEQVRQRNLKILGVG
jgi:hypothetical protein